MAEANETEEIKEEKKEKDPNNKIQGWDLLDLPSLFRKIPVGPTVEELQDSKVDQLLFNKERPMSHTLKDTLAFILGNVAQEAAGAAAGAGINKIKGARAISKYTDNILDTAADSAKKSRAMDLAARKSDDTTAKFIDDVVDANDKYISAKSAAENADEVKKTLVRNLDDAKKSLKYTEDNIAENTKKLGELLNVNPDDVIDLDLEHRSVDSLSAEERNLHDRGVKKFDLEEKVKTGKKKAEDINKNIGNLERSINNFPTDEKLSEKANDALNLLKSKQQMTKDYLNGMSPEDIAKKYGTEKQTYVQHQWNKNVKTAGKKIHVLEKNDEIFLNWLAAFGDDPRFKKFLEEINNPAYDRLTNDFMLAYQDLFESVVPGTPIDVINKNKDELLDAWDEVSKYWKEGIDDRVRFASGLDEGGIKKTLTDKANDELYDVAVKGGKQVLGNDIFGIKMKEPVARKQILDKLKKEKSYIDTFNKLVNPSDPIHKAMQKADGSRYYKDSLEPLIRKGMSIPDAIQDKALERVIQYYDKDYDEYLEFLLEHPASKEYIKKPDFSKSKLRNPDGTLKSAEEIADFLTKDPVYIDTINEFIKGLTNNANTFAKAGALEGAAIPLLGRYAERALRNGVTNRYDPFGKDPKVELPPNMKPWDASTEMNVIEKLWDNTKNFVGANFDMDPNRFSRKQLDDMRQAILNANEKVGKWNPSQINGWSDREVLRLIIEAGKGKRSEIDNEIKKEYLKLKEEQ